MDAFFASVEQRDDPALRGLPVAVGSARERGVVAAASYEARRFGVRSAMASVTALRRCPELRFVPPRFDVYRQVSQAIRTIFREYTDAVEPLSLDEAYLDVSHAPSATDVAREIRARIRAETGLTASAGVSYNKFIAKLASDHHKPDGLTVIRPSQGPAFVASLPVARFHGVGPRTAERMARLGITTGAHLRDAPLADLVSHFGSSAAYFHRAAHGHDDRPVRAHRVAKSIGAERTFHHDLHALPELLTALEPVVDAAWARIERSGAVGRTVTLKAKFSDFRIITRAASSAAGYPNRVAISDTAGRLLAALAPPPLGIRLLGVTLSGFGENRPAEAAQLPLALA